MGEALIHFVERPAGADLAHEWTRAAQREIAKGVLLRSPLPAVQWLWSTKNVEDIGMVCHCEMSVVSFDGRVGKSSA